ncbi:phosphate signaling complex protein PhoU [soil metagenome]
MISAQTSFDGFGADGPCLNRQLIREMEILWGEVLKLAAVVENALRNSVQAFCDGRIDLAERVRQEEFEIDRKELEIDRDCLRILALHQPVASDLRRVAVVMKINSDLERMGDLADHIAKRARKLARRSEAQLIPPQLEFLATEALGQVREALDALTRTDTELARQVIANDFQVDRRRGLILKDLKRSIRQEPDNVTTWLRFINIARNLERVADHATNIAESVIYLKEGEFVRRVGPRAEKSHGK